MSLKLYEYKGLLWEYKNFNGIVRATPFCPIDKFELKDTGMIIGSSCDECGKSYNWGVRSREIAQYLRRKIASEAYQEAEIISIDGIQTPQVKTRISIPTLNEDYWVEARLNESKKGVQLVVYVGKKGSNKKIQLFSNIDDEKLSFDHKDMKPEDIFTEVIAIFPSGKKMKIEAPKDKIAE